MCKRHPFALRIISAEQCSCSYVDLHCDTYECEDCALRIRARHARRIALAERAFPDAHFSFVTLTSHEDVRDADKSLSLLAGAFQAWKQRMQRRYGAFEYAAVFERHRSGAAHMHLLINRAVSKKHVRKNARALGLGYMADVQRIAPAVAGRYVSKYLAKGSGAFPKRFRRVRYSQKWPKLPERTTQGCTYDTVLKARILIDAYVYAQMGMTIKIHPQLDAQLDDQFRFEYVHEISKGGPAQ